MVGIRNFILHLCLLHSCHTTAFHIFYTHTIVQNFKNINKKYTSINQSRRIARIRACRFGCFDNTSASRSRKESMSLWYIKLHSSFGSAHDNWGSDDWRSGRGVGRQVRQRKLKRTFQLIIHPTVTISKSVLDYLKNTENSELSEADYSYPLGTKK